MQGTPDVGDHVSTGELAHVYSCGYYKLKSGVFLNHRLVFWKRSLIEHGAHRFSFIGCPPTPGDPSVSPPPDIEL